MRVEYVQLRPRLRRALYHLLLRTPASINQHFLHHSLLIQSQEEGRLTLVEIGGSDYRNENVARLIAAAAGRLVSLPLFGNIMITTGDTPVYGLEERHFSPCIDIQRETNAIAAPDFSFVSWPYCRVDEYDNYCVEIFNASVNSDPAMDRVMWRGNPLTNPVRVRFLQFAAEHPGLFDVGSVTWGPGKSVPGFVPMTQQASEASAQIDLPGNGYSARWKYLLHASRPCIWVGRDHYEYWNSHIPADYVKLRVDPSLSDLGTVARRALESSEARDITDQMLAFARRSLTRSAAETAWAALLSELPRESRPLADSLSHLWTRTPSSLLNIQLLD